MYLYSIYVLVEYEMWFTAFFFCFEGPFSVHFKRLWYEDENLSTKMEGAYYLNTTQLHDNVGDFFFYTYMNLTMVYIIAKHHLTVKPFFLRHFFFLYRTHAPHWPVNFFLIWIKGAFKFKAELFHIPFTCESLLSPVIWLKHGFKPKHHFNIDFTLVVKIKYLTTSYFSVSRELLSRTWFLGVLQ